MSRRQWEPEGFATLEAWRAYRRTLERRPAPVHPFDTEPILHQADCQICEGTGWMRQYDEFLDGWVDGRCPGCEDTTVKARKGRFEK